MKPKNTRYLGMSTSQLGILGGAAVVVLLVICGLSWFVFLAPSSGQVATIPDLSTPTQQVRVIVITSAPTPSPEIATSVPPDSWVEFQTSGATLWMPANFVGGDMNEDRAATISKVRGIGAYFKNVTAAMKQAPAEVTMWIIDKTTNGSPVITSVLVTHHVSAEEIGIDQFSQDRLKESSKAVNETNKISILGREARRITYQQKITAGYEVTGIIYFIKDGNDFWTVDYELDPNEYAWMQPIVEQSIHTFNLVQ